MGLGVPKIYLSLEACQIDFAAEIIQRSESQKCVRTDGLFEEVFEAVVDYFLRVHFFQCFDEFRVSSL